MTAGRKYSGWVLECPFMSPCQCCVRSDTPSSRCKFTTPPASKPKSDIETGISGKDKGGPSKGGFLNDISFSWIRYYLCIHITLFSWHKYRSAYENILFRKPPTTFVLRKRSYSPYSTPLWNRFGAVLGWFYRLGTETSISQNWLKG